MAVKQTGVFLRVPPVCAVSKKKKTTRSWAPFWMAPNGRHTGLGRKAMVRPLTQTKPREEHPIYVTKHCLFFFFFFRIPLSVTSAQRTSAQNPPEGADVPPQALLQELVPGRRLAPRVARREAQRTPARLESWSSSCKTHAEPGEKTERPWQKQLPRPVKNRQVMTSSLPALIRGHLAKQR